MESSISKSVLVVDDDEHIRVVVSKVVEHAGYRAVVAPGGPDALAILEKEGPADLIILDIDMPGMNGFEVLKSIRAQGTSTPVVMLTGRSKDEHVFGGYNSGRIITLRSRFGVRRC